MSIVTLNNVSLAYGHHPLLEHVDLQLAAGERVCLVGRNGTGKSTLLRVISGAAQADEGEIWRRDTLRISHLEQEVISDTSEPVYEVVAAGLGELGHLLTQYHQATQGVGSASGVALEKLNELQHRIDALHGWDINRRVETILSRLSLPADKRLDTCSGGVRRRVMLAQALVSEPDLLLLDEPTNHMDIAAITWLEEFLRSYQGALIFITHDRMFLKHLADRIIELDRGKLTSFAGNYEYYLQKKEDLLEIEARANAKVDKTLAEHEAWIRQGIKARRTRNQGKVRKLEAMRKARSQRIAVQDKVSMGVDIGELSGKLVANLLHVSFRYGEQVLIRDFSARILRGDRVGIMGPNGCGKSTLLKLILGELEPESGQVVLGTRLELAYFDQQRAQIDQEKTVRETLSEGSDYISVKGRSRHVIGYLKDFLFPPERIDAPVKVLSGGERNRLLLAKVLAEPANMLVLDEPTNDLDVDTLELLEDLLADYDGTLLLVSHDRTFLDNVVTSTIVFEGDGDVEEYVGGYEDWLRQRRPRDVASQPPRETRERGKGNKLRAGVGSAQQRKLTYKETMELKVLPERIEALELELQELEQRVTEVQFYQQEKDEITAALERLEQIRLEVQSAYDRWEYLDRIGSAASRVRTMS